MSNSSPETPEDATRRPSPIPTQLPVWALISGAAFFLGTLMLFCRLIWEQTVWTWERGPQMIGFSLAHGGGVFLFLFPMGLILWTVGVVIATIWNLFKKRRISVGRWFAIGAIALLFVIGSLPEGFWERVFISRMATSIHAGDLMLYAAYRGDLATVRGLVAHGAPIDAKDRAYWRTALHGAASKGDVSIIRFLASSGANINAVDRSGDSPLELALANHQEAAGNVLAALGAKKIQGDGAQRDKAIRDQVQEDIDSLRAP